MQRIIACALILVAVSANIELENAQAAEQIYQHIASGIATLQAHQSKSGVAVAEQAVANALAPQTPATTNPFGVQGISGSGQFGSIITYSDACVTQTQLSYWQSGTCIHSSTTSSMISITSGGISTCSYSDPNCQTMQGTCTTVTSGACTSQVKVTGPIAGSYAQVDSYSTAGCSGAETGPFYLLYGTCTTLGQFTPPQYCIPCPGGTCLNMGNGVCVGSSSSFKVTWNAAPALAPSHALLALVLVLAAALTFA